MIRSRLFGIVGLLTATGLSSAGWAQEGTAAAERGTQRNCALLAFHVTSVRPYVREVNNGKRIVSRDVRGAELYVRAQPGLTREWIAARLQQHVDEMGNAPRSGCPLGVEGTTVEVTSAGSAFLVRLIAPNRDKAEEVLRLARTLG